jgi:hypothetical protein
MRRGSSVGVILLLALGLFAFPLHAQSSDGNAPGSRERGFRLGQNYPNPFNPETFIPFELSSELFQDGAPVRVTIRIYNVLQQLVAVPVALNHPYGNSMPVDNLEYAGEGQYVAWWDGYDRTGRKAASGVYYLQLVINGQGSALRKMLVTK